MNKPEILKPIHPGDILKTEFLEINNLSVKQLALGTKLDKKTWEKLLMEEIPITYDLASRLSLYFDTSINFWMNLQSIYEEKNNDLIKKRLDQVLPSKKRKTKLEEKIRNSSIRSREIKNRIWETTVIWAKKNK